LKFHAVAGTERGAYRLAQKKSARGTTRVGRSK
jgi:hypothetical protein